MTVRLMSSNIWGDYFGNEVESRAHGLERVYRRYLPDVIGLQEMTRGWRESSVWASLADEYDFVPAPTEGRHNFVPILYRRGTVEVTDSGFGLYHEELDPSKGYTWASFRRLSDGKSFTVFNTHFMWKNGIEYDTIRRYNAFELNAVMTEVWKTYGFDTFFMGDLNCTHDSPAWRFFEENGWTSSYLLADESSLLCTWHGDPVRGEDGLFHGKASVRPCGESIDHIGMKKTCRVLRQVVVTDADALDATDHSPVFCDAAL